LLNPAQTLYHAHYQASTQHLRGPEPDLGGCPRERRRGPDLHSFPTRRSSDLGPGHIGIITSKGMFYYNGRFLHDKDVSAAGKRPDRKSTRLNSSHLGTSYAVFCLTKKHSFGGRMMSTAASEAPLDGVRGLVFF